MILGYQNIVFTLKNFNRCKPINLPRFLLPKCFLLFPKWNLLTEQFEIENLVDAPEVDGNVLEDPIWNEIAPITTLTQVTLNMGRPLVNTYSARVYKQMVYVAVVCFDSTPQNIVVSDSRRDADLNDEDSFLFIFDTYNDQQNGFLLEPMLTPCNLTHKLTMKVKETLAIIVNKEVWLAEPIQWDASWEVKTREETMAGVLNLQFHLNPYALGRGRTNVGSKLNEILLKQ